MSGLVSVFASFHPLADKVDEVRALLAWMVERSRAEPGCLRYDLYRRDASEATFYLFEAYRDDDALTTHRGTGHYVEYRRQIAELLDGGVDVIVLQAVDVRP